MTQDEYEAEQYRRDAVVLGPVEAPQTPLLLAETVQDVFVGHPFNGVCVQHAENEA